MGKQFQFELWKECNSKCKFCYSGNMNCGESSEEKISNMNFALNKISDLSLYPEYDTVAFIGGEFFQGQMKNIDVKNKFMELMSKVNELKNKSLIKNVWIYATLTIGDQEDLYETINKFDDKHNLWILTSYDTIGRFHTQKMRDNWDFHMKNIHKLYPDIKFNTTTILSGDFIEKYLNKSFNISHFMNDYNTTMYFKVPNRFKDRLISNQEMNNLVPNFFPSRKKFINFLHEIKKNESEDIWNRLFGIEYRADTLFCMHDGSIKKSKRDKKTYQEIYDNNLDYYMECGHLSVYNCYSDSDKCALCDKNMINELYS